MLNQPETAVVNIFKAFGAGTLQRVILTKISRLSEHEHSQPLPLQSKVHGTLSYMPKVGESFNLTGVVVKKPDGKEHTYKDWYSSQIVEFLPENKFKTVNSMYQYELL